jgi:predicted ATP-binding protein involved in virulence
MKVINLIIRNFRAIDNLSLDLSRSRNTVLVGINGSGKSSVLDCIAIMLAELLDWLPDFPPGNRGLEAADVKDPATECVIEIVVEHGGQTQSAGLRATRRGPGRPIEIDREGQGDCLLRLFADLDDIDRRSAVRVPIAVYYPVNRAVVEVPVDSPPSLGLEQLSAFEGALGGARVDFEGFFRWFRNREDIENEERITDSSHRDREIDAVRRAIEKMVPGFSNPRVRRAPPRMVVTKRDEENGEATELQISQLSDGEKCLIAMVGDIARRLAMANPGLEDPLLGDGVMLIDQIELHLHPAWQRVIVPALERTFANCQFIVTTHSPQVLSQVRPEAIYLLERTPQGIAAYRPTSSYGRDSNRILEELMGVSERPEEIQRDLKDYFRFIDEGNMSEAAKLREKLEKDIGADDPEFARADVLIRRREIIGK